MSEGLTSPTVLLESYGDAKRRGDAELSDLDQKVLLALIAESAVQSRDRLCLERPASALAVRAQFDPLNEILDRRNQVGQSLDALKSIALSEAKGLALWVVGAGSALWWFGAAAALVGGIYAGVSDIGQAVGWLLIIVALLSVTLTMAALRTAAANAGAIGQSAGQFFAALGGLWRVADGVGRPAEAIYDAVVAPVVKSAFPGGEPPRPRAGMQTRGLAKGAAGVVYAVALACAVVFVIGVGKGMSSGIEDACDAGTVDPRFRGVCIPEPTPTFDFELDR